MGPTCARVEAGLLLAAGAAGGAAAVAVASVPDSNGMIHACYQATAVGSTVPAATNALRIIDPAAGQTCNTVGPAGPRNEVPIAWNQQGPPGQQGPQGPQGKSVTIAGGNTLTIGGSVVTVGAPSGVTINTPPVGPGSPPIGSATVSGLGSFNVLSVSLGSGNSGGRASIHELVITKKQDQSSPNLFRACATGEHIPKVIFHLRKSSGGKSGGVYLQYTLTKVFVSSYQVGGHGDTKPTETVSFSYGSLAISYTRQHH
jgi:hypothetical protein